MDPIKTIGRKLDDTAERDCIHVAMFPAIAGNDRMHRGEEVKLVYGTENEVVPADSVYGIETIGIIDPFFGIAAITGNDQNYYDNQTIKKGDRVWVFLFPGTATGMRHHFAHPQLDAASARIGPRAINAEGQDDSDDSDWQSWNDGTVPGLCRSIIDNKRGNIAPLLADALEESGHHDAGQLTPILRATPGDPVDIRVAAGDLLGMNLSASVDWLKAFADKWNFDYDEMIEAAQDKEGYITARGIDLHHASELDPGDEAEFWRHMEALTHTEFSDDHRKDFVWSCTC